MNRSAEPGEQFIKFRGLAEPNVLEPLKKLEKTTRTTRTTRKNYWLSSQKVPHSVC